MWLGANDLSREGTWSWLSSNSDAKYTKFHGGDPNGGINENCLVMWYDNVDWADAICATTLNIHVCEKLVKK